MQAVCVNGDDAVTRTFERICNVGLFFCGTGLDVR